MPFSMSVSNDCACWNKLLTEDEYKSIKPCFDQCLDTVPVFTATLLPVRTNNFSNFAKDLFLPTLVKM